MLAVCDGDKFYNNRPWRRMRRDILRRDNIECQKCKAEGRVGKGESVHHIKHLREFPLLALIDSNLVTLCLACHNEEHPEKVCRPVWADCIVAQKWHTLTPYPW
ncbi:HNH endonuclease [Desulfitobacterium sp. PCE1]|uniref:HNH endonuclease n=2 Tax=Desulfitobacterium sp. PCE1 TaxID=146907 RepID=UPI000373CB34